MVAIDAKKAMEKCTGTKLMLTGCPEKCLIFIFTFDIFKWA